MASTFQKQQAANELNKTRDAYNQRQRTGGCNTAKTRFEGVDPTRVATLRSLSTKKNALMPVSHVSAGLPRRDAVKRDLTQ